MVRVKIEIEVKDCKLELTEEEAIALRDELDEALGVEDLEWDFVPPSIPYHPSPWEWHPWNGISSTTGGILCGCK